MSNFFKDLEVFSNRVYMIQFLCFLELTKISIFVLKTILWFYIL